MTTRFWLAFLIIFLINPGLCLAQQHASFRMENITSEYIKIEKGLSQNTVRTVLQDQEGFLWIGTWNGLNRFDGYSFKTFMKNYQNPESGLTYSEIIDIAEDQSGFIWVASFLGLNRIDKKDFSIKQFTSASHLSRGMVCDTIQALYFDRFKRLWIGTSQGVLIMDTHTELFEKLQHNPRDFNTLSSNNITSLLEDSQGNMWIGTDNGLNKYIPETGEIFTYYAGNSPGKLSSSIITAIEIADENHIWIGTPVGLNRHNTKTKWFDRYFLINPGQFSETSEKARITCLLNDSKNQLWVGTREFGLFIFNKEKQVFDNVQFFIPEADLFNFNSVLDIIEDNRGLVWAGTSHKGLVKLIQKPNVFRDYVKGRTIYGIIEPKENVFWFGTHNGVVVYDRSTNQTSKIVHEFDDPNSLINDFITSLLLDGDYIWIGTHQGVNRFHQPTGTFELFSPQDTVNPIAGQEVWYVLRDYYGDIWFCTSNGLSRLKTSTGKITAFRHDPANNNSLSNNACYHIIEESPGVYLISTQHGLNRFNQNTGRWNVFLPVPGDLTSISSDYVFGVYKDSKSEFWAFTNGGGINKFDPQTASFESFTVRDGLSDNVVYGIIEDDSGFLWLTTNNGLSKFDPVEERFTKFDVQDGILSNEFNVNSLYKTRSGEIFLGGVNGANSFYPQAPQGSSQKPPVLFTRFKKYVEGTGIEIPVSPSISLKYNENSFSVDFAALDFLNPFKNTYEYYLENFEKDWNILEGGLHQVEYRKLPPGTYHLHVIGSNNLGISDENMMTIKIIPAWWQTIFFRIGIISLGVLIISMIIYLRSRNISRKHAMEKQLLTIQNELVQSQKFALRSQMNPHFIFNALNSIQNFVLKNDVDAANYYLSNFSIMMRKVLEYSQHNFISLHEELDLIELYLKMEKLRFSNKFDTLVSVDPEIDTHMVRIPPMLLQPYLENSILHGLQLIKHRGLLGLTISERTDYLDIVIEDNGIGRERAKQIRKKQFHESKGLKNIEKRIQLYNKLNPFPITINIEDLADAKGQPSGTRVTISLPVIHEDEEL